MSGYKSMIGLQEIHLKFKDKKRLKMKKKNANSNHKKDGMALLDTIDIKIRNIIIDQKGHFNDKNVIH